MAQSLEDKVIQARQMQAQSLGLSDSVVDSITAEKLSQRGKFGQGERNAGSRNRPLPVDSLLSGPLDEDSLFAAQADTNYEQDSAWKSQTFGRKAAKPGLSRRPRPKAPPKRYEQRIFQGVDRSIFASAAGAVGRSYTLGPGDEITVSLWGDKEKEYVLTLNRDGKVFLEGVGLVPLVGNDLDAAQAALKTRLSRVYSGISRGTTHVDVSLGKAGPARVFVLGEVKIPGGYVLSGQSSVLSALYYAKGPTDIGTVRNLQLTRSGKKYDLDLYRYLIRGESLNPNIIQDGDILFARRADALVSIEGDVGRPAVYELKQGEGIKELLEFAGNPNPTAADHKLSVQRILEGGRPEFLDVAAPKEYLSGKATLELKDGDRVVVARSTETSSEFITVTGPVKYPGIYPAAGIKTVEALVTKAGGLRDDAFLGRVHIVRFNPDGSSILHAYALDTTLTDSIRLAPKDNVILYSVREMFIPDSVQIAGAVFRPGKYEFREGMTAKDLVMQAGGFLPHHEAGTLLLFSGNQRERKVTQATISSGDSMAKTDPGYPLKPNDFIHVPVDPHWYQKEIVTLAGLVMHPGKYALLYPGEKLSSVLQRAGGFKENAYVEGGRFFRTRDSVGRVGIDIRMAITKPKSKPNIGMVGGDSIFIPEKLNTVKVIGEVGFETSLLFKEGASAQYYIEKAGGFTRRSEPDRVVVQYANGETSRDGYFNRKPDAGSVIYVPQGPEPKPVDWFAGINALLGTAGVIVALILSISALSN